MSEFTEILREAGLRPPMLLLISLEVRPLPISRSLS